VLDEMRPRGLRLEWFVDRPQADAAQLSRGMVLALRLYSTACFKSLNDPLRCRDAEGGERPLTPANPHPFPVTVHLLTEAIKRLRVLDAESAQSNEPMTLWRGLQDTMLPDAFLQSGGSERAPMSTTPNLDVAIRYSAGSCSVLLRLVTSNFRERGADISWVSAFPAENEFLYPPLTHLAVAGRAPLIVQTTHGRFTVIEVKPSFG
jgi:hypothetical protein